jgi:rod shape-determining protein MreB
MRLPWGDQIAIDLGTANTHICVKGVGVVVREPSVIAFDSSGRRPVAVGLEAKRMLERDVEGVQVVRPIRNGVVAHFDAAVAMLRTFIQQALGKRPLLNPLVITSHPNEATIVEQRALVDTIRASGGGQIISVQRALATALGSGLSIGGDQSQMVIDLGAGMTSASVVAMGLATTGISIRFGGDDLDEVIRRAVRRSQGIRISLSSAEQVKLHVGTLLPPDQSDSMRVDGVGANGEPAVGADISVTDVPELLTRGLTRVVGEIAWVLEELPPRQQTEVSATGAVLTGGGALLGGIDAFMAEWLGIPVRVATDPPSCTILGLEAVLNDPHAVSLDGRRFKVGN